MDNVITILIDSVSWQAISRNSSSVSTTPFIDSLKEESITCSKLYSQGPYTDAATKALYTGENTTDNFGYYFRINNAANDHFSFFHENGYYTYGLYYPYYLYGEKIRKKINETFYTGNFIFESEWGGLFYYYAEIAKKRKLDKYEYYLLEKRLFLMFEVWIGYYNDLINNKVTATLITKGLDSFDIKHALLILQEEKNKFESCAEQYIDYFLSEDAKIKFRNIDKIHVDANINRDFIKNYVYKKYWRLLIKANNHNFFSNLKKNRLRFNQVVEIFKKFLISKNTVYFKPIKSQISSLFSFKSALKSYKKANWQLVPSTRKQLDFAVELIKRKAYGNRPFYISLHTEDLHGDVAFFSFDTEDKKVIDDEFCVLSQFIQTVGTNFKGNLAYLLSLRYVDYCIERFVEKLKEIDVWNNTTLIIASDHGHPNIGYPIHNKGKQVNCFFDENYHIPLLIRSSTKKCISIDDYCNSKDILPTVIDLLGLKKPNSMLGKSLILKDRKFDNYVITEYVGPGCPDMLSKELWLSIRNDVMLFGVKISIYEDFRTSNIVEAYDLKKDPNCQYNIISSISFEEYECLLTALRKRLNEIKDNNYRFMEHEKCILSGN